MISTPMYLCTFICLVPIFFLLFFCFFFFSFLSYFFSDFLLNWFAADVVVRAGLLVHDSVHNFLSILSFIILFLPYYFLIFNFIFILQFLLYFFIIFCFFSISSYFFLFVLFSSLVFLVVFFFFFFCLLFLILFQLAVHAILLPQSEQVLRAQLHGPAA